MSTEQNKAVVRRFIEAGLNNMDAAFVDELFAPDYVNHLLPGGREGFKQFFPMMRSAFPDLKIRYHIEHLIAEGDYVVARITYVYTNAGKEATGSGLSEYRFANGKIVEDWPPSDGLSLMQQVGITLPSGPGQRQAFREYNEWSASLFQSRRTPRLFRNISKKVVYRRRDTHIVSERFHARHAAHAA